MCALQDFDEPDKLHIQMNDIITIIEGRWVKTSLNIKDSMLGNCKDQATFTLQAM